MSGKLSPFLIAMLVLAICGPALGQLPVLVDEDFSGASDPLAYWYQDPAVSQDSFGWDDPNDNMWGEARRGRSWTVAEWPTSIGTAERAYIEFDATGYGDSDVYLGYAEDFDFSIDVNFSSFVPTANDEDMAMGFWYTPEDTEASNASQYVMWPTRHHFIGVHVREDGGAAWFQMLAANAGDVGGRGTSANIGALQTNTDYRFIGHYRYGLDADGVVGQLYGEVYRNDGGTWVLESELPYEEIVRTDGNIHGTAWFDMSIDSGNRQFTKLKHFGVSNWTQGTTQLAGPQFTSDNWLVTGTNVIPEPGTLAMLVGGTAMVLMRLRRKK